MDFKNFWNNRLKTGNLIPAVLLLALLLDGSWLYSQENYKDTAQQTQIRSQLSLQNTRGGNRFGKVSQSLEDGHAQYRRIAMMDGNLVTGPVINSGLISYSGIGNDLRIGWPKGVNRSDYIWGSYFYVAGEVLDVNNDIIHIVSDNFRFGEVSPDGTHEYATMPLPKYFNLDQPDATSVPLIYGISEDVGIDGNPRTNDFGEGDGILQPQEDFNANGELDLRMKNVVGWFSISHRKETWPEYWPAGSYPGDTRDEGAEIPGERAGRWNGEFGSYIRADQESYYVMDDRENDEFEYYPFDDPRPWPNGRRGLGVTTEARAYQWNARLAEDILISIFDITNNGKDLPKCVVGMYVDPDMGGSFTNDDAFFDEIDDITYSWNKTFISNQGLPLGYFGFAFLESPGLGFDGIDNDQDGLVDETQGNGIDDDGDWVPWEDANGNGVYDTEDVNYNGLLDPGEDLNENGRLDIELLNDDLGSDGLGPEFFEYSGPDPNGTEANGVPDLGEPNFEFTDNDESDQVGLTSWYLRSTREDPGIEGDEHFWSNEIPPGTFEIVDGYQVDISFTYGSGYVSFSGGERTHRYAIALVFGNDFDDILRNKRTMQVIYDNDYNFAKPPRQPVLEATADDKRVFLKWDTGAELSRDPIYGFDFEAYYVYKSTEPSFQEIKTITDGFGNPFLFEPLAIFDLDNGLKGLHPVAIGSELGENSNLGVTYNMGTDSGLEHNFVDVDVTNGRTYYYAVASVDQGYIPAFYPDISEKEALQVISPTECAVNIQVDPLGRPISFDPNTVQVIPTELSAGWMEPRVSDEGIEHTSGRGTGRVEVQVYNPHQILTNHRYRVEFEDDGRFEQFDTLRYTGFTNKMVVKSLTDDATLLNILNPKNRDLSEDLIVEGFRVILHNDTTKVDTNVSYWSTGSSPLKAYGLTGVNTGQPVARDYEIRVLGAGADTSLNRRPTNFQVWDVTDPDDPFRLIFLLTEQSVPEVLDHGDRITIFNNRTDLKRLWGIEFRYPGDVDSTARIAPEPGDVLQVITQKIFDRNDSFEFTMIGNDFDDVKTKNELDDIYTVPDPYIAVSTLERKVVNEEEGRGDRKIDFVNLPKRCTIRIFTVSGRLVRTLEHAATEKNRRLAWDLRTKDGLEISHGMYFYVVDAPGIGSKTGKFAVIK